MKVILTVPNLTVTKLNNSHSNISTGAKKDACICMTVYCSVNDKTAIIFKKMSN